VRNDRTLAPKPRSRLTNQRRISEDEVAVLFEAIGDDLESSGFSSSVNSSDDVHGQRRMGEMTNRELVGAILTSSACMRRLIRPDAARLSAHRPSRLIQDRTGGA
jgi:hypothetical protein